MPIDVITGNDGNRMESELEIRTKEFTPEQYRKELFISEGTLLTELEILISKARRAGYILAIDKVYKQPLAIGNYDLVGSVYEAREMMK